MLDTIGAKQKVDCNINRNRRIDNLCNPKGKFHLEHWRNGKLLARQEFANGITDEGKKKLLNLYFYYTDVEVPNGITYGVYIGLINTGAVLDETNIYATHAGWTEYSNYTVGGSAYRADWAPGAATGTGAVSITNAVALTYDITGAGGTIYGIFTVSGQITEVRVIGDTSAGNVLWATGALAAELTVVVGDQLKLTYTVTS